MVGVLVQLQASVTGDLLDMEAARTVQKVVASIPDAGPPPNAAGPTERDLAVFLGYQTDPTAQRIQRRINDACRALAASVGGHDSGSGGPISSVYLRLHRNIGARLVPRLLHKELPETTLASMSGELGTM